MSCTYIPLYHFYSLVVNYLRGCVWARNFKMVEDKKR